MKIKLVIIVLITLFLIFNLYSFNSLRVLILPFEDNNMTEESRIYAKMILDTLKTDLDRLPKEIKIKEFEDQILKKLPDENKRRYILKYYQTDIMNQYYQLNQAVSNDEIGTISTLFDSVHYKRYIPLLLSDIGINESIYDYRKIYKEVVNKRIDLIITGFYLKKDNRIRITIKLIDVETERVKIIINDSGKSDYEIFSNILETSIKLVSKMNQEIDSHKEIINVFLREKQSRIILGEETERFLFFSIGLTYSGIGFISRNKKIIDGLDIASSQNAYVNSVNPVFNFQIFQNYKSDYHGFVFRFLIPFTYFNENMRTLTDIDLGYSWGFKKQFFFEWALRIYYFNYNKFSSSNSDRRLNVNYMGIGIKFLFYYLPLQYPYFFEAGVTLFPPFIPLHDSDSNISGPLPWNITTGYTSYHSWFFPLTFHLGAGYFFQPKFGIYISTELDLLNIYYEDEIHVENDMTKRVFYGEDFGITFFMETGFIFKNIIKF